MDKRDFERESRNHSRKIDTTKRAPSWAMSFLSNCHCHDGSLFVVMQSVCGTFHILYDPAF